MAPVENNVVTKKGAPSYTHVEAHQFRPILIDSSPEDKLMDLINNKGWDGHTVYDRKKGIFTTALYLAAEEENTSVISWLLDWSPNKANDILEGDSNGRTALHAAAATKDPDVISSLLLELNDAKQDFNVADKEGNTPLHIGVKTQNVEVIQALLDFEADPCQKNNEGDAPLHLAVKGGNLEVVKELLRDVDTPGSGEETPLHLAVKGRNLKVLKEPLSDADTPDSGKDVDTPGQTRLDLAVGKDMVVMLIANGADPCRKNEEGESPLHLAALQVKVNESEVFQLLLHTAFKARLKKAESVEDITNALEEVRKQEDGAFTEALEALKYGWNIDNVYANKTALHLASEIGNETLVKVLLKSKPDRVVNLQDELGNTALHFAASGGYFGIVKLLLDASADVKQQNKKGDSPLHSAVGPQGKNEIVTELLKAGAETNKRNKLGQTPLHFAVAQKTADIAGKLADKGANFSLKDNTGAGVLHFAARGGGRDIFELLKDKLNVNEPTTAGLTPLHFAAWNGNEEALRWLLESEGIKLDAPDNVENGLPWQWAAMGGQLECLWKLIKEHVERRKRVFPLPGSHKEWNRVFQRIEDHNQARIIDWVAWTFLSRHETSDHDSKKSDEDSKSIIDFLRTFLLAMESHETSDHDSEESQVEKDSSVLEPGILSCAAAYGDPATNECLVRVLTNLDQQKRIQVVKDSRLMEWAALSSIRGTESGGKRRFSAVKVVMEFLMKKYSDEKAINNQLRLAFKIAFLNAKQCEYEKQGRNTFAKCMAECFAWELPNMIKEAIWQEIKTNGEDKWRTLPSKYKNDFKYISELVEDVPVAYWEVKLEEERRLKGSKGADDYSNAKKKKKDDAELKNKGALRKQLADRVKQYSKKFMNLNDSEKFIKKVYLNDTGPRTGRTALHWATIFEEPETVIALSAKGCKPDICDSFGKPPYWDAQAMDALEDNTVMMNCLKWSGYADSLHKDRQMFVDGLNAILVGSALIASVTFGGFLSPPMEYKLKFKGREYVSMDITGVVVFWVANSLSFFFAMASALAGVTGVLPSDKFNLRLLRRILIAAAVMLVLSISFVLVAFGAAGLSALPPLLKYQRNMIFPSVPGALVCIGPLCMFIYAVYNLKFWGRRWSLRWSLRSLLISKADHGSIMFKQLVAVFKQCNFKAEDLEGGEMRFGRETLEELLSWETTEELSSPSPPQRYTRNGQLPWEDGLDSLVQTDGETVRAQDESLHTSRVQRRVQDEPAEARTNQEDEGRSDQTVITVTHS